MSQHSLDTRKWRAANTPWGSAAAGLIAIAALAVAPAFATAQEPVPPDERDDRWDDDVVVVDHERGFSFDARAGTSLPAGDLNDLADPGFGAGLGLAFHLSPQFALRLDGDMSRLSEVDADEFEEGVEDFFEGDLNLWHYGGGLQFNLADPRRSSWDFLVMLGAGATTIDPNQPTAPDPQVQGQTTRFTANGGVRVGTRPAENVGIFLRGTSYAIFLQDDDFVDGDLEQATRDMWWAFPVQLGVELAI